MKIEEIDPPKISLHKIFKILEYLSYGGEIRIEGAVGPIRMAPTLDNSICLITYYDDGTVIGLEGWSLSKIYTLLNKVDDSQYNLIITNLTLNKIK